VKKILLIITLFGSINAQDVLTTISGSQANGKFIEVTETHVVFQQVGVAVPSKIPLMSVARVVLSNGDVAFTIEEGLKGEIKEKYKKIVEQIRISSSFNGNKISKIYHLGTVNHLPLEINRKLFSSEIEAKNGGYRPCSACFDLRPSIPDYYFEKQLAAGVNSSLRYNYEVIYEHSELPRVQTRLNRLINQWTETLKGYDYRILIVKDESPNAFAVAGGNIYLTTGLLEMIEDDTELDFIIAHEIAHVERRHTLREFKETQKRANLAAVAAILIGVGVAATGGGAQDVAVATQLTAVIADFSNQFALKGFSREMEQEADIFAQLQLSQMGIQKEKIIFALDKLATHTSKLEIPLTANAFSDHPGLNERIDQILNSEIINMTSPRNFYIVENIKGSTNKEDAIINITIRLLFKGPSSNKSEEDIITLIGNISNNDKINSYQINNMKFKFYGVRDLISTTIEDFPISRGSKMDFATTISINKDKSDKLLDALKSGQINVVTSVSKVSIKPGEGVKKSWNNQPLKVSTFIQ